MLNFARFLILAKFATYYDQKIPNPFCNFQDITHYLLTGQKLAPLVKLPSILKSDFLESFFHTLQMAENVVPFSRSHISETA